MKFKKNLKTTTDTRTYTLYKLKSLGYWSRRERKFYRRKWGTHRCWKLQRKNQWKEY